MATRQSVEDCMNRCEDAILYANEQLDEALRQGFYQDAEFNEAQAGLEQMAMEVEKLKDSSNAQQREQLDRTRLKVQQLQNQMILQNQERPPYGTMM